MRILEQLGQFESVSAFFDAKAAKVDLRKIRKPHRPVSVHDQVIGAASETIKRLVAVAREIREELRPLEAEHAAATAYIDAALAPVQKNRNLVQALKALSSPEVLAAAAKVEELKPKIGRLKLLHAHARNMISAEIILKYDTTDIEESPQIDEIWNIVVRRPRDKDDSPAGLDELLSQLGNRSGVHVIRM